jgi:histone-lysine N-methyltransferase MLL3
MLDWVESTIDSSCSQDSEYSELSNDVPLPGVIFDRRPADTKTDSIPRVAPLDSSCNKKAKLGKLSAKKPKTEQSEIRGMFGKPGVVLEKPREEEFSEASGSHMSKISKPDQIVKKGLVLCSTRDDVSGNQDLCASCGSIGQGQEGRLIACAQCGQAYHPYCIHGKVSTSFITRLKVE